MYCSLIHNLYSEGLDYSNNFICNIRDASKHSESEYYLKVFRVKKKGSCQSLLNFMYIVITSRHAISLPQTIVLSCSGFINEE